MSVAPHCFQPSSPASGWRQPCQSGNKWCTQLILTQLQDWFFSTKGVLTPSALSPPPQQGALQHSTTRKMENFPLFASAAASVCRLETVVSIVFTLHHAVVRLRLRTPVNEASSTGPAMRRKANGTCVCEWECPHCTASNIKGFAFEFARASCVDWA